MGRAALLACWAAFVPLAARAQGAPSGYEVALSGADALLAGRSARIRGVAYRVHGLAELRALPGAIVRARCTNREDDPAPWQQTRADTRGFFVVEVAVPATVHGAATLAVAVGEGESLREIELPVSVAEPYVLDLRTDRQLYEPGERVHVWARLTDARSLRPLESREVRFEIGGEGSRAITTSASGVASFVLGLPARAVEGPRSIRARVGELVVTHDVQVGTRRYARLFATARVSPETAAPHAPVTVEVAVTTPSGAPVRGARVDVTLDAEQSASASTDATGHARVAMHAPVYLTHDTGVVSAIVRITHPAHGSTTASASLRLAVPHTLRVEAVAENAGLVPEVPGRLYVRLADGGGEPPPAGTEIEVSGPAIRGGRARASSDAHGLAVVPTQIPLGAAVGSDEGGASATVVVRVGGAAPRTVRLQVPVLRDAEVVPRVERPVSSPGETVRVTIARSPVAPRSAVVVELLAGRDVIAARVIDAHADRTELSLPDDRLGLFVVRARPLRAPGGPSVEGTGASDAVLVRPAQASFPELAGDRDPYPVGASARLTLRTGPSSAPRWAAVLVRDLAAHEREQPFSLWFLSGAFDRAVLDPSTPAADTLLRTAMAAYVSLDSAPAEAPPLLDERGLAHDGGGDLARSPERGTLRDPHPLADELRRRGVAEVMRRVEELLGSALDDGSLDELTEGRGAARRFRADVLESIEDRPRTLGDGELTLAMLSAADPSFTYASIARRVARARLVQLVVALAHYLDPGDEAPLEQRVAAREPSERWLPRMVERGLIDAETLMDPWGGRFVLRRSARPALALSAEAAGLELVSPGPDGRVGSADDVRDPFARAVPEGTPYALASGEDGLMRALARLSPGADVLRRLVEAYRRVAAEVAEDEIGDAVNASVSEGLYGDASGEAFGYGGLGLRGTGRGGGGSGAGTIGLGSIGTIGRGSGSGYGMGGFGRVVRERFPATLAFRPEIALDASGTTSFDVELGEAVTTYLVEAVVWGADGWSWSTSTRLRVDREVVIDAPVPEWATVGDVLELPVRVGNRGGSARALGIEVRPPEGLGITPVALRDVQVAAADARELPVELALPRAGRGHLVIGVRGSDGTPLDAVRRPIEVRRSLRRVRRESSGLVEGSGELVLEVPAGAVSMDLGEVRVRAGVALFGEPADPAARAWAASWAAHGTELSAARGQGGEATTLAAAIAIEWRGGRSADASVANALVRLTRMLGGAGAPSLESLQRDAAVLLALAPAVRQASARPAPTRRELMDVVGALRRRIAEGIGGRSEEDTTLLATAAAALAWTTPARGGLDRVRELLRRLDRRLLRVGDDAWIATEESEATAPSALVAIAEVRLGQRARAFALLRTLLRLDEEPGALSDRERALARVAALLLGPDEGTPPSVRIAIDGAAPERVALRGGLAVLAAPALSRPGRHVVHVQPGARDAAPLLLDAWAELGLEWSVAPPRPGPLVVRVHDAPGVPGVPGVRDTRAAISLEVRNRSARTVGVPVVEVALPAGAELDEEARAQLRRVTAREPESTRGTLTLHLPAMAPGASVHVPLSFTWSVAGRLRGLGIASFASDRPQDVSIERPRVLVVRAPGRSR